MQFRSNNDKTKDEKRNQYIAAIAIIGLCAFFFNIGGFGDYVKTLIPGAAVPGQAVVGQPCTSPGQELVTGLFCTASDGSAGKTKSVCSPLTYRWESTCVSMGSTVTPSTPTGSTPQLVCPAEYASFNVMVEDSLDEEAAPQTLLTDTVRIISSSGQELASSNSTTTGAVEMKIPCKMDNVQFITTGALIYESDSVTIGGVTYSGATVPTYFLKDGRTPIAYNIEPALVKAKKMGNVSVMVWNADPTATNTTMLTLGANSDSKDYIRIKVSENDDDEAVQGVVLLIDYPLASYKKIELEGITPGLTAVKDASAAMNNFSSYDSQWRLYMNGKPLTLDRDTRTADLSDVELVLRATTSAATPLGTNITVQPVDSMRFLGASGTQVGWAHGGQFMTQDDNMMDIGLTVGNQVPGYVFIG